MKKRYTAWCWKESIFSIKKASIEPLITSHETLIYSPQGDPKLKLER